MFEVNGIMYAGSCTEMIKIRDAKVTGNLLLLLTFSTGEKRILGL
jgi:predicted O-methyltransferase YrrM